MTDDCSLTQCIDGAPKILLLATVTAVARLVLAAYIDMHVNQMYTRKTKIPNLMAQKHIDRSPANFLLSFHFNLSKPIFIFFENIFIRILCFQCPARLIVFCLAFKSEYYYAFAYVSKRTQLHISRFLYRVQMTQSVYIVPPRKVNCHYVVSIF